MPALLTEGTLIRAEENPTFGYELMKRISRQLIRRLEAARDRLVRLNKQNTRPNSVTSIASPTQGMALQGAPG